MSKFEEKKREKDLIRESEFYKGHSKEFTRRQFLYNAGLMSAVAGLGFSNLPKLFIPSASAQATVASNLAFVGLECGGGFNFGGNVIVGRDKSGTQNEYGGLDGYIKHGLPSDMHPSRPGMVDSSYGLQFHKTSGILIGMNQVLQGKTVPVGARNIPIKDMVDGVSFLCRSSDDTGSNPINSTIPAVIAGAKGVLANLIGTRNTPAGGGHTCDPLVYDPKYRPPLVTSEVGSKSLLSLGSNVFRNTQNNSLSKFMDRLKNLSDERLKLISEKKLNPLARARLTDAMGQSGALFNRFTESILTPSISDLDTLNTIFPSITPASPFEADLSLDKDFIGTIGYLLFHSTQDFSNLVGAATVSVGGCDYHNGTAASGVRKDLEIGRYIGEIIYYAALKGKSVVIDMYTDGSASGGNGILDETVLGQGRVILRTDSPVDSGSIMIVYNHGKPRDEHPIVIQKDGSSLRQVGNFINVKGGGMDLTANGLANNINHLWKVKMLNYLALMEPTTDPNEIVLKFEAIYGRGHLPTDAKDLIRLKYLG